MLNAPRWQSTHLLTMCDALLISYSGVLDRGLAIIELLAESADGLPLSAISEELRIPRSATHRLLTSLSGHGYVRQEEERGTYVLHVGRSSADIARILALYFIGPA